MPDHVVVDGSNLATEGRQMPSLKQLNEAVLAFMAEHPDALVTVVVDATFGHRIDPSEVAEFDEAVSNNELVAPPAGAIGRGDAFVLSIAHKVGATILTNDSYQEFHGRPEYAWLFEEGRLIGGKPVPHIGWVFVNRLPVRGAVSRQAVSQAKRGRNGKGDDRGKRRASAEASQPMPIPKEPPPRATVRRQPAAAGTTATHQTAASAAASVAASVAASDQAAPKRSMVNDFMQFLSFVEKHPVGTSVNAEVESYSSHGAYVTIGDVRGYVPLRLMADPPPRSARDLMKIGESVTLVVESFEPTRRSIDLAMPTMATVRSAPAAAAAEKRPRRPAKAETAVDEVADAIGAAAAEVLASAVAAEPATEPSAPARKKPAAKEPAAKKATAQKAAPTKAAPKKVAAKKAASRKVEESGVEESGVEDSDVDEATVGNAVAERSRATKAAAPATKAPAKKAAAKKATTPATKAPAKKAAAPAKKTPAKKAATPAKKAPAKTAAKTAAARKPGPETAAPNAATEASG